MTEEIEKTRVQEIAERTNGSPPKCFIQRESNRPVLDASLAAIPIIDLSYEESKDLEQREIEDSKLRSASSSGELFYVLGHGIPTSLIDEVRNITRSFFNQPKQPLKEKLSYTSDMPNPYFSEGYETDVVVSNEQILDWNDKLLLNVYPEEERNMDLWPQKPESFREVVNEFNEKILILVDVIFKALARSLGLDEVYFINNGSKGRIPWRFNYYPPCSKPDLVLGMKPHSDGSSFTIILQDDQVSGLQVFNNQLGWLNVPVLPYALLVVLGDEIEIKTNGQYKSVMHKVVTNSEKERISLSMFILSELKNEIGPIDELIEDGKPKLYKSTTAKDYGADFFVKFSQGIRPLDSMRI
ncbi:hypothetical protein ZOSMA_33G00750 [Zostera marina]|uniref:Fe2OG dioxygenase domain-containing protein n=1 Tax=Zostera marina TaxID=29655 RepID=A0A0K9P7R9_ZOSMR|nr:hypothetical protein ZOSMA_33G00750 [Zostera marina]